MQVIAVRQTKASEIITITKTKFLAGQRSFIQLRLETVLIFISLN